MSLVLLRLCKEIGWVVRGLGIQTSCNQRFPVLAQIGFPWVVFAITALAARAWTKAWDSAFMSNLGFREKGFMSIKLLCSSSQGWSFTFQPQHKNKMFIDHDDLQNAFLLVCEKLLLMKLMSSCFSILPLCVCTSLVLYLEFKLCWKSAGVGFARSWAQGGAFRLR